VIERVIQHVLSTVPISTGYNLDGFEIDTEEFLGRSFPDPIIRRTKEPTCVIDARATVGTGLSSLQDVSHELTTVWNAIAYSSFEASAIEWHRNATVLRFVTVISNEAFCVTGRIVVSGGPYDQLVEAFERDFGPLRSLAPP
jgi:hypothetical protein